MERDYPAALEAFRWTLEAADRGIPAADSYLADMYEQGLGVERNFRKALEYYRKAARVHFGPAENGLGVMYFCGEGVRQDFERSTQWYRAAIRDGSDLAKVNLAVAYENGLAVPRDRDEAARLFEDAYARGSALAKSHFSKSSVAARTEMQSANVVRDSCLLHIPERNSDTIVVVRERPVPASGPE